MRLTAKPVLFGTPMLVAVGTFMLLWLMFSGGGGGVLSGAELYWNVELTQKNAAGEILYTEKMKNSLTNEGFQAAMERVISSAAQNTNAAESEAFDNIVLLSGSEGLNAAITGTNVLTNIDGGQGGGTGSAAGGPKNNPADGGFTDGADGVGSVAVTFLADGDPAAAVQMALVKSNVQEGSAADDIVIADILAKITISVDLADTDTLTVTWTITAS